MSHLDGFQCERLAAAILQEQGYVCEVCELRTHRYTSGDGGEQYQNRVDFFREFDVIAIPTQDARYEKTRMLQVTRNQSATEREEKKEAVSEWSGRHKPSVSIEFWYWNGEAFEPEFWRGGHWAFTHPVEPGLDADQLLARHDESADRQVKE